MAHLPEDPLLPFQPWGPGWGAEGEEGRKEAGFQGDPQRAHADHLP